MRALFIDGYAPVPSARLDSATSARPWPGEVRVRVEASSLNPLDAKLAQGVMGDLLPLAFPYAPSTDFAGEIVALGEHIVGLQVGDAVLGRSDRVEGGALAEAIVVPARLVTPRPAGLDAVTAACLPTPAGIAHQALFDHLRVAEGATLLVIGAGGAVGRAAVQLAPAGVTVIACFSQSPEAEGLRSCRFAIPPRTHALSKSCTTSAHIGSRVDRSAARPPS